jgi:hypothetical protein
MSEVTYRFRLQVPGVSVEQLETEVGVVVGVVDYAGGVVVDVACDDSRGADLIDSMAVRGFELVSGDPPTNANTQFREDNELLSSVAAALLDKAIFKVDGGMIYSTDGDVLIKVNQ